MYGKMKKITKKKKKRKTTESTFAHDIKINMSQIYLLWGEGQWVVNQQCNAYNIEIMKINVVSCINESWFG